MSKDSSPLKKCPYPVGAFSGITIDGKKLVAGPLSCNSWNCPYCHDKMKKRLYRRVLKGVMGRDTGSEYSRKFLTLTYGGTHKRCGSDPVIAYEEMALAFHKLIKALRERYGHFDYFRVCELHKDGWPHFHVMLVGDSIAPKDVLDHVELYWREYYGMGFVRINCIKFKDAKHATNYMLKYITKDIQQVAKRKRIFSASRDALLRIEKMAWSGIWVYTGSVDPMGVPLHEIDYSDKIFRVPGYKEEMILVGDTVREFEDHIKSAQRSHMKMVCPNAF